MSTTVVAASSNAALTPGLRPRVLFVGGFSRSGSTLVGRMLGEAAGAVCVGETRYLWERGIIHNVQCGCGEAFRSCPFWGAVGDRAFGGWERVDVGVLASTDRMVNRLRSLPAHRLTALRPRFTADVSRYASQLARLYLAIAEVSGSRMIVETSKDPNFAWVLRRMAGYDVRILHLVRDPRAVACSWARPKRMTSPIAGEAFMPTFGAANTATRWMIANAAFHGLAARAPYARRRYEDFVRSPGTVLGDLGSFAAEPLVFPRDHLTAEGVKLGAHHIFSGNPMSARTGRVELRADDRWRRELPRSDVASVTALTWPLLRSYGYPLIARVDRDARC